MQDTEKTSKQILYSALLSTGIVTILTNPLDVIKVRLQKDAKNCGVNRSPYYCQAAIHQHISSSRQNLKYGNISLPSSFMDSYVAICNCIPFKSNYQAIKYIAQTEGRSTLVNGLGQALTASIFSNVGYLYTYERVRVHVKEYTQHPVMLPLCTSTIARTIVTSLVFPLDYWKTVQQSVEGKNKSGFSLHNQPRAGYGTLLTRDVLFSGIYWILVENTRNFIKYMRNNAIEDNTYDDGFTLVLSNAIAGAFSGGVAAFLTLPLDVVKTRRQLYPKEYEKANSYQILHDIYQKEGFESLFTGYRARLAKVTISCAGTLTLYELFNYSMRKNSMFE